MANSYVEYTTTGSGTNGLGQTTFTAPTKFLSINDIRIKGLNGSTWTELTISSRGTTTVTLSAAPTAYSKIRVFRSSTTEALIDFQNGSRLAESDLDTAYRQSLFVAQEVAEDADPEGGSGIGNIVSSQLAGISITNDKLAGSITQDKLAGGITSAQLAGSIADSKLASGVGTSANNLVKLDGTAKLPAVDGSQLTNVSAGKILQVQYVNYTTTVNYSTSYTDIMTKNITPSATNSVILIQATVATHHTAVGQHAAKLVKDGSALNYEVGDFYHPSGTGVAGNIKIQYVDSPNTTNAVTYKIQVKAEIGSGATNKDFSATNNGVSSLVLMEIAS